MWRISFCISAFYRINGRCGLLRVPGTEWKYVGDGHLLLTFTFLLINLYDYLVMAYKLAETCCSRYNKYVIIDIDLTNDTLSDWWFITPFRFPEGGRIRFLWNVVNHTWNAGYSNVDYRNLIFTSTESSDRLWCRESGWYQGHCQWCGILTCNSVLVSVYISSFVEFAWEVSSCSVFSRNLWKRKSSIHCHPGPVVSSPHFLCEIHFNVVLLSSCRSPKCLSCSGF